MPENSEQHVIFLEMRSRIDGVLVKHWHNQITTLTAAYDQAFANVNDLLQRVKAAIIERQQRENALMVTTLSILTGGVASVLGDDLVKNMPTITKTVLKQEGAWLKVVKVAQEDAFLYKVFKDTTKDLLKKGVDKVGDLALDQFKGEPPDSGFQPVGMRVAAYTDALTQGIDARAQFLWDFADSLYQNADSWTVEMASSMRQGLYQNDFFQEKTLPSKTVLIANAELALWAAWALARDENYWIKQVALVGSAARSESLDWAPVRDHLVDLGVPEDAISVAPVQYAFQNPIKGLDVVGLMKWARRDFVHTLFDGLPGAFAVKHWAECKMMQARYLATAIPAAARAA